VRAYGDSNLKRPAFTVLANVVASSPLIRPPTRVRLLRSTGIEIGHNVDFRSFCWIYSNRLRIGDDTFISYGCHIENREFVDIGARCRIANQVAIITSTHSFGPAEQRAGNLMPSAVTIQDGCWIGARAILLPGITVGRGCVVGAGAVVTRDCAPDGIYLGVPARLARSFDDG
jgi:maltose O-acetyltransferase